MKQSKTILPLAFFVVVVVAVYKSSVKKEDKSVNIPAQIVTPQ